MSKGFFVFKGVVGMMMFSLAPVYCVWSLRQMSVEGTLVPPVETRKKLEKSFRNEFALQPKGEE